jgi:hypothetical protein
MRNRLVIRSVLAFCLALGMGRLLFPKAPAQTQIKPAVSVKAEPAPIAQVSLPAQTPAPAAKNLEPLVSRSIDREFRVVEGGVQNDNARMTHLLSTDYVEGVLHRAPYQFNAFVRWVPQTQELLRGDSTVTVLGKMHSSRATLEKGGRVVYPETYSQTDERMTIRPDGGMEHDIILRQPPAMMDRGQALAYTGRLRMSKDLTMWDGSKKITANYSTKNDVHFKNQFGNTVFNLRSPVAYDAAVTAADGTLDTEKQSQVSNLNAAMGCSYRFEFDDEGVKLSIVTPGKWLADPSRAYPVVIDPNFGPFGLADGDPPIYTGTAGADTLIPANTGGTPLVIVDRCPSKPDNGYGIIPMPFPFEYYGTVHPQAAPLYVHIDGFASWDKPNVFPLTPNPCNDVDNQPIPTAGYPDNVYFAYWDDLRFSTVPGSGIYWFIDGVAPTRRLVIEWYKMGFSRGSNNEVITFNLVLYECENKIQMVIGQTGETDRGLASVGIEDQTGLLGIQYEFNSALGGAILANNNNQNVNLNPFINPFANGGNNGLGFGNGLGGGFGNNVNPNPNQNVNTPVNNGLNSQPITPGTALVFSRSVLGFLQVATTPRNGCVPFTVCFLSNILIPVSTCTGITNTNQNSSAASKAFGFQWTFGDNSEAFTPTVCHTWVTAGTYQASLKITDEFGTSSTLPFIVRICDVPDVVISLSPQGGLAPLIVDLDATASSPTVIIQGAPVWQVDRLGAQNQPGIYSTLGTTTGTPVQAHFDTPGIYRVTVSFSGTDTSSGLPTTGVGTAFVFVASATDVIEDSLIITESKFTIDWVGKRDGEDPDGLSTSPGGAGNSTPGQGMPDNPENDTLFVRGYISLPGVTTSDLLGRRVTLSLNGTENIFEGVLDASGNAKMNDILLNRFGSFSVRLPSGAFSCNVHRSLYTLLGVADATEARLLPAQFGVTIDGIFPTPPATGTALITYDYRSHGFNFGPPAMGAGNGSYKFGGHTKDGFVSGPPDQSGRPGGMTQLISGAFLVTSAKIKLEGNNVYADLKGLLSRYGGDALRPADNSDVVISIGSYSEVLNFTSTTGFKTTGKYPSQRFTFKRPKSLGKTGIAQFNWQDRAGTFALKTNAIPNELVGINPAIGVQTLVLNLQITPESSQVYNGQSRFEITKKSATQYLRNLK